MNTKTIKSKIKMLQIPVTEKEFDILKAKADKEKRSLPNSIKIILEPFLKGNRYQLDSSLQCYCTVAFDEYASLESAFRVLQSADRDSTLSFPLRGLECHYEFRVRYNAMQYLPESFDVQATSCP